MVALGVLAWGLVQLATGALHASVGRIILRREARVPDAATANRMFAVWWFGLALLYLASGPFTIAYAFGWRDLPFTIAYLDALLVDLCVALWGVLSFLVYVYTGTNRWTVPIGVFYGLLAFGLLWLIAWIEPTGFGDGARLDLQYARQLGGASSVVLGLLFSVPIFVVAVAYLFLAFRVRDRAPRYRISLVGGAFAFQFGWSIVSAVLGLARRFPDSVALDVVNGLVAVLVPVVIIFAYRPPARVQAWLAEPPPRPA